MQFCSLNSLALHEKILLFQISAVKTWPDSVAIQGVPYMCLVPLRQSSKRSKAQSFY